LLNDKFRSKHRKRVPISVNLPVRAMACRTDFACWEASQTLWNFFHYLLHRTIRFCQSFSEIL